MSTKVIDVANAIVEVINDLDLSGLGLSLTARRTYATTDSLEGLADAVADVIPFEQTATRNDRSTLLVIQTYRVFVRKRFEGDELNEENVAIETLDAWQESVQMIRNISWKGPIGDTGATKESVEITTPFDTEAIKSQSALVAMLTFTFRYYENQQSGFSYARPSGQ